MAKNDTIHVRVNEDVKLNAEETLNMLGMTLSEAINMFLCQVSLTGGLPFDVRLPMPKEVTVRDRADLVQKLAQAEADIQNGNVSSPEDVFGKIRGEYGI
ncbi:MAG: type II toxin-antitoxin system RelB/DinJ family antitoxin [Acutalibacteraceae bacterium]|nr:type II toxin-antitoxin system RelB/DinJ family antitoxin [Acutalibacteraceae bacterium]